MHKIKQLSNSFLRCIAILLLFTCSINLATFAQQQANMRYIVSVVNPLNHLYHVQLNYIPATKAALRFRMCAWTPGFYEIEDFGGAVSNFTATDEAGRPLNWKKAADSSWEVKLKGKSVVLNYDVKADNPFIANANLDENHGYFVPGAMFMYLDEALKKPLTVQIKPYKSWTQMVATGLDPIRGSKSTYLVKNFDVLYDSPFLMGKLEAFPSSIVNGKSLQFIGYNMGSFDRRPFMEKLTKIAVTGSALIGDVPYNHYTFLAVGENIRGFGGIEHLNSVSLIMANDNQYLEQAGTQESLFSVLAHEYFHLYNVKRIRPIALGPFDYSKENYTNMLWVSEGFTDYYEYLIMRRAGLMTQERVLANYQEHISNYENTPGHLYQSLIQSSRGIWAQRGIPQQRTPEEQAKTISVYDKGCAMGMLLDLKIRHETHNKKSLDDVMRGLYAKYYRVKKRGFTDAEFQQACESAAGVPLKELFGYASTVAPIDYPKYLAYAGLKIDTLNTALKGLTIGTTVRYSVADSSLVIREVYWPSSASDAGLKAGDKIKMINGVKADKQFYDNLMNTKHSGDQLQIQIDRNKQVSVVTVTLSTHYEKSFKMTPVDHPDALQTMIYNDWLR